MSSRPRLRVGLIGLGRMGRLHARVLRELDGVDLVAAVDPVGDPYNATPGLPVYNDLDALLRHRINYAVLACPTSLHEPLGTALAAERVPTLIEKPLAASPAAAHRLVQAFHRADVPAAIGYTERFNPALDSLAARVHAGQLGDIFEIATCRIGPFPPRVTDIGVIHDLATHDLDLTAWISQQRYTSIAARTTNRSAGPHEDLLTALALLTGGTIALHRVNRLSPFKERTIAVTGDNGCLIADTLTTTLSYHANGAAPPHWGAMRTFPGATEGDTIRYAIHKKEPLVAEHEAFREAVLGHHPTTGLQHGLDAVLAAHSAVQASRSGTTITVPLVTVPVVSDVSCL